MEVVLESTEGCPEGGVLSIKHGDTKRQAPVSKIGQPFRFSSSLAEPLPLKVELLLPAADPQLVYLDPHQSRVKVDFGGGVSVTLVHKEMKELQRPPVDVTEVAESRGLAADKLHVAQQAASYLEQHDLVRTFQDIIHGLLVSKPEDPLKYVEDCIARTKVVLLAREGKEAPAATEEPAPAVPTPAPPPATAAVKSVAESFNDALDNSGEDAPVAPTSSEREPISRQRRASAGAGNKVDALINTLQQTHDNLSLVLPMLPDFLRDMLCGRELAAECCRDFKILDVDGTGLLKPRDLVPLIVRLSNDRSHGINDEQCQRFVAMFDTNQKGVINEDEFLMLLQFVIITSYLESPDGKQSLQTAKMEDHSYMDFIKMIEEDQERLWTIIPFLPEWIVEHVTSIEFMASCSEQFSALDVDGNGTLEPIELIPVIQNLCSDQSSQLTINAQRCEKFVSLFNTHQNGVVMKDEFVEFAQFLAVMNFLTETGEGAEVKVIAELQAEAKQLANKRTGLLVDTELMGDAMESLPYQLKDYINGAAFEDMCSVAFDSKTTSGRLKGDAAIASVVKFCCERELSKFTIVADEIAVKEYMQAFDKEAKNSFSKANFLLFARYCITLGFLYHTAVQQEVIVHEVIYGKEIIADLLSALRENLETIGQIAPFLPEAFKAVLLSAPFQEACFDEFRELDKDNSGALEPAELFPVLLALSETHQLSVTTESLKEFVRIFDSNSNGVITAAEYIDFARFMMIMGWCEKNEIDPTEPKKGPPSVAVMVMDPAIEELFATLERDMSTMRKVVPCLPKEIFDHLTSDEFVSKCNESFKTLDKDKNHVLQPTELMPVVEDFLGSAGAKVKVTEEECKRFTAIFDVYGDGVLRQDEFLDFTRFVIVMSYLHMPEGSKACKEAVRIYEDTKCIEDLLEDLSKNRFAIQHVLPYLPGWLRDELLSSHFQMRCMDTFCTLDKDGNGKLEPVELYPLIQAMATDLEGASTHIQIDFEQCERFTSIFDEAGEGVIRASEFVNFCRFQMVMSWLQTQEGQIVVDTLASGQVARPPAPTNGVEELSTVDSLLPNVEHSHLAVDCEFYQTKADRLASENELLKVRLRQLEDANSRLSSDLETKDVKLRHAEVDRYASGRLPQSANRSTRAP